MAAQRTFLAIAYDRSNAAVAGLRLAVSPTALSLLRLPIGCRA